MVILRTDSSKVQIKVETEKDVEKLKSGSIDTAESEEDDDILGASSSSSSSVDNSKNSEYGNNIYSINEEEIDSYIRPSTETSTTYNGITIPTARGTKKGRMRMRMDAVKIQSKITSTSQYVIVSNDGVK